MPIYQDYTSSAYRRFKSGPVNTKVNGKYPPSTSQYVYSEARVSPPYPQVPWYLSSTMPDMLVKRPTVSQSNKLYSKLREELMGDKGELLTSAAEWRTSLDMISGRVRTIYGAYLAVRRFRFKEAAELLNIAVPGKFKDLSGKAAKKQKLSPTGIWLEYWMGWAPLVGDIGLAVNTLTGRPPQSRHFSVGVAYSNDDKTLVQSSVMYTHPGFRWTRIELKFEGKGKYSAYGDVTVTNHNRYLASKLGFTNPILTAWQLLPFSFMVDWFANVGTVLGSLTDFEGLAFSNTGTAIEYKVSAKAEGTTWDGYNSSSTIPVFQVGWSLYKERNPGSLPSPRLEIKMLDKLSLTRAATSISLLVEIFLRKK